MTSRGLRMGMGGTRSGNDDDLGTHVLAVQCRFPVIEKHRDDFLEVLVEFLEGVALAVRSGKPGHVPDVEARIRATFHDGRVTAHRSQRYDWDSTEVKRSSRASARWGGGRSSLIDRVEATTRRSEPLAGGIFRFGVSI